MFSQPSYRNYPPNVSYNPYFNSSYPHPSPFSRQRSPYEQDPAAAERARALAAQRSRRHQYLPDEDEDSGDEWEYNQLGPRERAYLDARRKQDVLERMQKEREEEEHRAQQERRWQDALNQRQKEEDVKKQQRLEEKRRAQRIKQEQAETQLKKQEQTEGQRKKQEQTEAQTHLKAEAESKKDRRSSQQVSRPGSPTSIPIHVRRSPSPPSPSIPTAEAPAAETQHKERPRTPKPEYGAAHEEAAGRIQKRYRIHQSFRTIHEVEDQFAQLKKSFVLPHTLDFQNPGSDETITISAPAVDDSDGDPMDVDGREGKLAYTSANYPFHQYSESLDRFLVKLDGIESWGNKKVRKQRRAAVKSIEAEAARIDRYWKNAWRYHQTEKKSEPVQTEP